MHYIYIHNPYARRSLSTATATATVTGIGERWAMVNEWRERMVCDVEAHIVADWEQDIWYILCVFMKI